MPAPCSGYVLGYLVKIVIPQGILQVKIVIPQGVPQPNKTLQPLHRFNAYANSSISGINFTTNGLYTITPDPTNGAQFWYLYCYNAPTYGRANNLTFTWNLNNATVIFNVRPACVSVADECFGCSAVSDEGLLWCLACL